MKHTLASIAALTVAGLTHADIILEISRVGEAPDGQLTQAVAGEVADFDVWVWGTGPDTGLTNLQMTIAGTPGQPGTQWNVLTLGTMDPNNSLGNGFLKVNGTLVNGSISNAGLVALPPNVLALGNSPGTAFKLYGDFTAQNLTNGGLLTGAGKAVNGAGTVANVQFIGVIQTPAPTGLGLVVPAMIAAARRRRG